MGFCPCLCFSNTSNQSKHPLLVTNTQCVPCHIFSLEQTQAYIHSHTHRLQPPHTPTHSLPPPTHTPKYKAVFVGTAAIVCVCVCMRSCMRACVCRMCVGVWQTQVQLCSMREREETVPLLFFHRSDLAPLTSLLFYLPLSRHLNWGSGVGGREE